MRSPARRLLPWAALCGLAAAANWLIREEAIWIVAPIGMLLAGASFVLWRERLGDRAAVVVIVATICAAAPILGVCEINRRHYGVFAVVDTSQKDFVAAYGSLLRVGSSYYRRYVPVPAEARQALYAVSPSFARMRPKIDGEIAENWVGRRRTDGPPDIQGGWFIWAFREAAQEASGQNERVPNPLP
jgi:hypothetical protein